MDIYAQIAEKIIEQQESIIGPIAIDSASNVDGMEIDWPKKSITISSAKPSTVIDDLVKEYQNLFGKISVEVCKEAASTLVAELPTEQRPATLR